MRENKSIENAERAEKIFKEVRRRLYYPPVTDFEMSEESGFIFGRRLKLKIGEKDLKLPDDALKGSIALNLNLWASHPYSLKTILLEEFWLRDFEKRSQIRALFDEVVAAIDLLLNRGFDEVLDYYRTRKAEGKQDILLYAFLERIAGGEVSIDESMERKLKEMLEINFLDRREMRLRLNLLRFAKIVDELIETFSPKIKQEDFGEKEMDEALKELARELDQSEFQELCQLIGKKTTGEVKKPEKIWYMERSRKYSIYIQPYSMTGSLYPSEIREFEFDGSVEEFSPIDSYGKLIPGIAKKYAYDDFEGRDFSIPDAVVVIDSSGSMADPSKSISYAVLGAMAVARNYLENGARVGVVNFSNENISIPPSRGERVFDAIILYQGGGTHLDVEGLKNYLRDAGGVDVIMITDGGIENIEEVSEFTSQLNSLTVIWIKSDVSSDEFSKRIKKILKKNVNVFEVKNESDIPSIAVKRFVEVFGRC
jgi:hypothetical protein